MQEVKIKLTQKDITRLKVRHEKLVFDLQESSTLHNSPNWGRELYDSIISRGNTEKFLELVNEGLYITGTPGVLAKDELRSTKNLMITIIINVMVNLIDDMYLDSETAFSISDAAINELEESKTVDSAYTACAACLYLYTESVASKNKAYHPLVRQAKEYVYKHFHENIKVKDIAEKLDTSPSYLAQVFVKNEGLTIHEFIKAEKIERSKNLIMYSDMPIQSIAEYLAFASPSHFAREFKAVTGQTPTQFKNKAKEFSKESL